MPVEELLILIDLNGQTRCIDVYNAVCAYFETKSIPFDKLA